MPHPKAHHLVSRGYLKSWSDDGRRVLYIDKQTRSTQLVGMRAIFVEPGLLTVRTADETSAPLETAFSDVENQAIPLVRSYIAGSNGDDNRQAVIALMALHFARSFSLRIGYERLYQEQVGQMLAEAPTDMELKEAFQRQYGRAPSTRELRALIKDTAADHARANLGYVESVEHMYNKALEYFEPMHLQRCRVLTPNRGELLVSDSPVLINSGAEGTATAPVALMDADLLWFPLSPQVGVSISTEPIAEASLNEAATRKLNLRVWDYAVRYLAARSGANINRALGYPDPKIEIDR